MDTKIKTGPVFAVRSASSVLLRSGVPMTRQIESRFLNAYCNEFLDMA